MIRSMTAFGRAAGHTESRDITVEMKSVNNRFFDCSVKLPRGYAFLEDRIKTRISGRGITRGKMDVYVSVEASSDRGVTAVLDRGYTQAYIAALRGLSAEFALKDDISVMTVAQNRDIFIEKRVDTDEDAEWAAVQPVLDTALEAFMRMREAEGERTRADITAKMENVRGYAREISALSKDDVEQRYEKLRTRISSYINDAGVVIDEGRLLTECALFADKIAIDEELARLDSHFAAFDEIVSSGEGAGRKLDFLMQEFNRETNTIGSKAGNIAVTKLVLLIKNELEKIREQIQNIE